VLAIDKKTSLNRLNHPLNKHNMWVISANYVVPNEQFCEPS